MNNIELIHELATEALNDETTVKRWRWVAVLNLANDNEIFGVPVSEEGMMWAQEKVRELDMTHCLPTDRKA